MSGKKIIDGLNQALEHAQQETQAEKVTRAVLATLQKGGDNLAIFNTIEEALARFPEEANGSWEQFTDKLTQVIYQFHPDFDFSNAAPQDARQYALEMIQLWNERPTRTYKIGDYVSKKSGGQWHGKIVGFYSTHLTEIGYAVESFYEEGSVQIYPEKALQPWNPGPNSIQEGSDA